MDKKILVLLCGLWISAVALSQTTTYRTGIFLHHSSGGYIWGPNGSPTSVPIEESNFNSVFGYGNTQPVSLTEVWWPVNGDNEWSTWHSIFDNTNASDIRPILAANKIVMIKSCFPSSSIGTIGGPADTLTPTLKSIYNYKWHWRSIVHMMSTHRDNFFIIWTNAPLIGGPDEDGPRADAFCHWAKDTLAAGLDPVFGPFPSNVYVFDYFHKLADPTTGKLPLQYAVSTQDDHPNAAATALVAPQLVSETFNAAIGYENTILPVSLTSFRARCASDGHGVVVEWKTISEVNNYGFTVQSRSLNETIYHDLNAQIIPGHGTTTAAHSYSFVDATPVSAQREYRLKQIDLDGTVHLSETVSIEALTGIAESHPVSDVLNQNYPNPFNPQTEITFSLRSTRHATLELFDMLGQKVATLFDGLSGGGVVQRVTVDGSRLSSGSYFYRLQTEEGSVVTKRMTLVK